MSKFAELRTAASGGLKRNAILRASLGRVPMTVLFVVALGASSGVAFGQQPQLTAAGNPNLLCVDVDDDGVPCSAGDCVVTGTADADGSNLTLTGNQTNPPFLRACSPGGPASYGGGATKAVGNTCIGSMGGTSATLDTCQFANPPNVPVTATASPAEGAAAAQPVVFSNIQVSQSGAPAGGGLFCHDNGPAVLAFTVGGVPVLRPLEKTGDYMCAPNVPVQLETGELIMRAACFPVNHDGTTDLRVGGGPQLAIAIVNSPALQECMAPAPTMTTRGLILLLLALLAFSVWSLGRSRRFYESLPLL